MAHALQKAVESWSLSMEGRDHPVCFTQKEFIAWKIHEIDAPTQPIRQFACRDCTRSYQQQMTREGLCINPTLDLNRYGQ